MVRRRTRREWTERELALVAEHYPMVPTGDIARKLDRTRAQVYGVAQRLGLKKSPEYFERYKAGRFLDGAAGVPNRFRPGHTTWNKGMRYHAGGGSIETQFHAGDKPHNTKPIGSETWDATGYLKRKIRDDAPKGMSRRNWKFVHVLLWEEHNGPVPDGHAVRFVNGDRRDIRIENLELIDRRDLMRRNTVHRYPKEVALAIQLRGALTRQINKRMKADEEQDGRPA